MEIARSNAGGGGLAPRTALKAAKKAAKHAVEKHAAKKHAGKKAAAKHAAKKGAKHAAKKGAKHAGREWDAEEQRRRLEEGGDAAVEEDALQLTHSFHHLHRATAVISLLEHDSGWRLEDAAAAWHGALPECYRDQGKDGRGAECLWVAAGG